MDELNANIDIFLILFCALRLSASCPEKFWGEAALHAVYNINRLPTTVLQNLSPFEKLFGQPPDYSILKPFGCASCVLLHPHECTKLEPHARLYCILGYGIEHKGYRCWDLISNTMFLLGKIPCFLPFPNFITLSILTLYFSLILPMSYFLVMTQMI